MSLSRIHIAVFSDKVGSCLQEFIAKSIKSDESIGLFCASLIKALDSGISNHYCIILDNYSVGGDQIDYTKSLLNSAASNAKKIEVPSYRLVCASDFGGMRGFEKASRQSDVMHTRIHACIKNMWETSPFDSRSVILCIEEIVGPTLRDDEQANLGEEFCSGL